MEWGVANRIEQINAESGTIQVVDEVVVPANGQGSTSVIVKETDFLWTAAVAVSTGTFASRCESKGEGRFFDNDFARSENFWGTAANPLRHPPKFVALNGELDFTIIDTSGQQNTVALYLHGHRATVCGKPGEDGKCKNPDCLNAPMHRKCDRARWGQGRGLYVMSTQGPALPQNGGAFSQGGIVVTAGGKNSQGVKVVEWAHFRAAIVNGCAYNGAGGNTPNAAWKGQITKMDPRDERAGTYGSSQAKQIRGAGLVGSATAPARPSSPIVCHKANNFIFDVTDLGLATTNTIHFALIGETLDDDVLKADA